MSTVQEIESALSRLSPDEMRQVRDWLENQLEDQLEMTSAFKESIERSEREMARRPASARPPVGSRMSRALQVYYSAFDEVFLKLPEVLRRRIERRSMTWAIGWARFPTTE